MIKIYFSLIVSDVVSAVSANWSQNQKRFLSKLQHLITGKDHCHQAIGFYSRPSVALSVKNRYVRLFSVQSFCLQRAFFPSQFEKSVSAF